MTAWNGGVKPNLLNVFPMVDDAAGLDNWVGRCQGRDCSFYLSDSNSADCEGGPEPSGNETRRTRLSIAIPTRAANRPGAGTIRETAWEYPAG